MSTPPRFLIIGQVLKPWGYRGEIKIQVISDFPQRFASLRTVFIGDDAKPFSVERARLHGKGALFKLHDIDTPEAAAKLRGQLVQIAHQDAAPLPTGKYYLYQLLGLRVKTIKGEKLGELAEVLDTGANDVYVVREGSHEILIPAIEDVVKEISLERGEIVVKLMEGLI